MENANRKSHTGFRLVPISMTVNDRNASSCPILLYRSSLGRIGWRSTNTISGRKR